MVTAVVSWLVLLLAILVAVPTGVLFVEIVAAVTARSQLHRGGAATGHKVQGLAQAWFEGSQE